MTISPSHFEKNTNYTPDYDEIISYYEYLSQQSENISMKEAGKTDSGKPLHEIVLSKNGFTPEEVKQKIYRFY